MFSPLNLLIYAVMLLAFVFIVDAAIGFFRASRGIDDTAVKRRLAQAEKIPLSQQMRPDLLRPGSGAELSWRQHIPFQPWLSRLIVQSGVHMKMDTAVLIAAFISLVVFAALAWLLPLASIPLSFLAAIGIGAGAMISYFMRARTARRRQFEEQLPDAIDLIVRSLKVGHPLSASLAVIGREMQPPISTEFQIAFNEVTYGVDVASAVTGISNRVGAPDLGYLTVAVQIQQESGGNLAESLSKLSGVVRERFRMFRKVKAVTAEGRFSAWLLSVFPLGIAFVLQLIQPTYYSQIENFPYFSYLVAATIAMLLVNLIAMRILTSIKV